MKEDEDTRGTSRQGNEDPPESMYEEYNDKGRGERVCRDRLVWHSFLSNYPARDIYIQIKHYIQVKQVYFKKCFIIVQR